ncbi:MAG TPA: glycoside hydrolase family 3 C-terminal domain-containing protein [Solirubrobacteraceae bacterium]|nr:glycoside hydrolase family 3 C-terminal domain-containing protein [Solirubrobacteraceae bacterium]
MRVPRRFVAVLFVMCVAAMGRTVHLRSLRRVPFVWKLITFGLAAATLLLVNAPAAVSSTALPSDVPYALPVTALPGATKSPTVAADAPYTPAVLNLIAQLEPGNHPTEAELANADALFHGGTNSTCYNVGPVAAPTGTSPSITPMCWSDAQGINVTSGPNVAMTTGPMDLMGLGATFNRSLANVWGQTEGKEGRELMVTGLFGPQTDLDRMPDWGRNLTTTGADPYLSGQLVAAQINGIQGVGLMSEMKHFAAYNGEDMSTNSQVQDQAMHELYLTPYEAGFVGGRAAATMCSYQLFQDTATTLPGPESSLASTYPLSPFGSSSQQTWPLDESHQACEQPLTLTYALRDLWGSKAMVGSDYGASYSTSGINQGEQQEMPFSNTNFSDSNQPSSGFGGSGTDPTGDTCASATGAPEPCTTPGAVHVAGIPGPGCPVDGCTLVEAVANGTVSLPVFNQALATMLYQEQRFGLLGCTSQPVAGTCTNPSGVDGNQTGQAPLPTGPTSGATPGADLGTKNGDEAVAELESEEGGVLLKNDRATLPITGSDLRQGVLVTGPGAQYTIADPTTEASVGFEDRDVINPLQQLEAFSGHPGAFTYDPALDPVGAPVPASALSTSSSTVTGNLAFNDNGASKTASSVDYTTVSPQGQLAPGKYAWTGYLYVPTSDTYTLDFQFSNNLAAPATPPIVATSWSAGTATLTVPSGTPAPVGTQVIVGDACPSGYDGTYTVTASTATSVSYALPSNPGTCNETLNVTGGSWQPGLSFGSFVFQPATATLDFASTATPPAVGSSITVAGVTPAGYDGTFTVTASTPTSVTYALSTNPGTYSNGGTIAVSSTGLASIGDIHISFDGSPAALQPAAEVNDTATGIAGSPTNAGYTQAGLTNLQFAAGALTGGKYYPITLTLDNTASAPASFRFGYNRASGDIADAAAAAKGKSMAIVFVDDSGAPPEGNTPTALTMVPNPYYNSSEPVSDSNPPYISGVDSLPANQDALVQAVAAANPNTVVVINSTDPVIMPWVANVKSVLEMWYSGEEGGTSTARLLLGLADPSGHLPITFPAKATDTIWAYNETVPLYPGDTLGPHLDRLNGNGGCSTTGYNCPPDTTTNESEGIFTDYRFFDKEGITPLFPFGWGLSYTHFAYSGLQVRPTSDGGFDVSFNVTNTGNVSGAAVPQVYLGAPSNQPAGIQFAVRQLVQFTRVPLLPHQSERVSLDVAARQLQYWSATRQQWLLATGDRTIYVGSADATHAPSGDPGSPASLPLQTTVDVGDPGAATALACTDEQLSATAVTGDLVVPAGDWCDMTDATVTGNLLVSLGSAGLRVVGSTIDGNVRSTGTRRAADPLSSGEDVVCNTVVKGKMSILFSGRSVPWNLGQCGGDTVQGSVTFVANRATGSSITGTSIGGNFVCLGNGGVTTAGNTVHGKTIGECRSGRRRR